MQRIELPPQAARQLINDEQASSFTFRLMQASVALAVIGLAFFFIGFFYQKPISAAGLPYRQFQAGAILVIFLGWLVFNLSANRLGISTRKLTYNRLRAILRNQVEVPYDEEEGMRKRAAASLSSLGEHWTLYPTVFSGDPSRRIPMVITGPGGVFPLTMLTQDPRQKGFVDPLPALQAGSAELEKRLGVPVQPVLSFLRGKKKNIAVDERIKAYTLAELSAYLNAREAQLTTAELARIDRVLRELAHVSRG